MKEADKYYYCEICGGPTEQLHLIDNKQGCSRCYDFFKAVKEAEEYCKILELDIISSKEDVRRHYLDLVNVWHPDRFSSPRLIKKANEKLKQINSAYQELPNCIETIRDWTDHSLIEFYKYCYHELDDPAIPDAQYDRLVALVKRFKERYGKYDLDDFADE